MVFGQIAGLTHNCFIIEEGFEDIDLYCPGEFTPVHLGDRLDDATYTVVYKLGSGSTSTAWLARDNRYGTDPEKHPYRYIALKILRAEYYSKTPEIDILNHLQASFEAGRHSNTTSSFANDMDGKFSTTSANHPGIIRLIHTFTVRSPNGSHALILPVVRPLDELKVQLQTFVQRALPRAFTNARWCECC